MELVLAFVLLVTFALLGVIVNHLLTIRYAWNIPSYPAKIPFLGHAMMFSGKNTERAFRTMARVFNTNQRMTKLLLGPIPAVLIHHPDLLQKVLTNAELYDKPFLYDLMKLGRGLITERNGLYWKQTRKAVNPAFSMKILGGFVPIFDSRAKVLVERLKPLADGVTDLNLLQYVAQCTLEMIFSTTMGCHLHVRPGEKEYVYHLEQIQSSLGERMLNVEKQLDALYRFSASYRREMKSRVICDAFTDKIIQERRARLAGEKNNNEVSEKNLDSLEQHLKSNIFLDEILNYRQEGVPLEDQEVSEHLRTMMAAGNETSALTTCYVCLFLAQNPEIQDKVVSEMREIFHSPSVELNTESLKQLLYTEMVIRETLRLVPVVPFIARETGSEIELDGVHIPRGQILVMNFYSLHRRKDFWGDEPERFDPERFRPEAVRERHPYAYLPFSAGFRNCIGSRYAMNSLKTMLTRLLMAFEVRTTIKQEDMKFKFEITMKLVGAHTVQLVRREQKWAEGGGSQPGDLWTK
ncbi:cytochrome P450 4c21-like [Ochlerotatus camptorhynchus]|uniref:cytochrome P450 4c21-like n=1 Tax=Ochlerotatus camptorhynchus TaxID=644619 RepID=UPI0031E0E669